MDNSIETKHNKLIVFDLNLYWNLKDLNEQENKDMNLVLPLIEKAAVYQTPVISTSAALKDAIDFVKTKSLEKGYIVAAGGAAIYDIAGQKVVFQNPLSKEEIETTFHHGLMLGLNMVITTLSEKYIFISNSVTYEIINKKAYSPYKVIKNYTELCEVKDRSDILDIAFLHLVSPHKTLTENFNIYKWDRYFDNEINELKIKVNRTSLFAHVAKQDSNKLNALIRVMLLANVTQLSDVLYIATTSINQNCFIKFKNCLISTNTSLEEEIKKVNKKRWYFEKEIGNIDDQFGLKTNSFWK